MKSFPHYHDAGERKAVQLILGHFGYSGYCMWYEGVLNWLHKNEGEAIDLNDEKTRYEFDKACLPMTEGATIRNREVTKFLDWCATSRKHDHPLIDPNQWAAGFLFKEECVVKKRVLKEKDPEVLAFCKQMFVRLTENFNGIQDSSETWYTDVKWLVDQPKIGLANVKKVWDWIYSDDCSWEKWKVNIKSGKKLRQHYATLEAQMSKVKPKGKKDPWERL
jgi:hypothetical protein